ncbi:MAG: YcxB family protein [Vulcanibacillus sp.]
MEQVNLQFNYNENEYVNAVQNYLLKKNKIKRDLIFSIILVVGGLIAMIFRGYSFIWLVNIFVGIFFVSIVYAIYYIFPAIRFKKEPIFGQDISLIINEDGVTFNYAKTNSVSKWSDYREILENNDFFYLVFGKNMYRILPKRIFTLSEVDTFKEVIKDKIKLKSL